MLVFERRPYPQIITIILAAALATELFRETYYLIFPWVLSFNLTFPQESYTSTIGRWVSERDGIEIYVVYAFTFVIMGLTALTTLAITKMDSTRRHGIVIRIVIALAVVAVLLLGNIRFTQPLDGSPHRWYVLYFSVFVSLLAFCRNTLPLIYEALIGAVILLPVCFISTSNIAVTNYAYMLGPAQKLLDGVPVSQIYFQYEFFISAVAALWMKLGFSENYFQVVGQFSNFVVMLGIFVIARKLFVRATLAYYLLTALILFRILGAPWDPVYVFQITPLRLELWLVPFLIVYLRGPYHWLVPFACGILILVHGALGLIYALGYLQIILTLSALAAWDEGWRIKLAATLKSASLLRIGATALYLLTCYFIAKTVFAANIEATSYYQKIGIGFLPLLRTSLFWCLPVVIGTTIVMLFVIRKAVTERYLALGFGLLFFCIGNCIYFLGRSHEHNVFSVSISVIFLLFYALDVSVRYYALATEATASRDVGRIAVLVGGALLVAMAYGCSAQIEVNLKTKYEGARALQLYPGGAFAELQPAIDKLNTELDARLPADARVQFLTYDEGAEFVFYQGRERNESFFYPLAAWIFVDDLVAHVRDLLVGGIYLLVEDRVAADLSRAGLSPDEYAYNSVIGSYVLIGRYLPGKPAWP
ncbi:MAG: hypothetical protein MO846_12175 [Candidatus Devosia symbiotica]|nr:hypothetical protein [Candidatus Devosia symbiotica]